ncbi:type I CRISPR-associated protein Cas7 [Lutispora sp.]|uniref:type I CRISPR-associated protein Cas7 n=1 Tax=Lutispora sp. TaxID=2828727 RepID=UPI002B21D9AF|nr:type I CRISPR-associated protein Cas7 [Lutispora sp.]MEA4964045.1 type I CRISPR-associated protein Cas7 [Lutispora sp.]
MMLNQNSDFLYLFQSTLSNPNGDPDQENKPRMDYETSTILVSDGRRKRDIRDYLKNKGFKIFVDTLADQKVPMDKMFYFIRDAWLDDKGKMNVLFSDNPQLKEQWEKLFGKDENYKDAYLKKEEQLKKNKDFTKFNNEFLTEIIKRELIDIRLFGSAMAVGGVSKTFTGPVQINWGYSLHPVDFVKSSTITSIMNEDSSTFGKKYKLHYALIAHYGTINKYSARQTGMSKEDRDLFRKAIVQSIMANQTDSKQGQEPLLYLEIVYKPDFDGYLGDLRRFIDAKPHKEEAIRSINDITVDFDRLRETVKEMNGKGYIEKIVGWKHPFAKEEHLINMPEYEEMDLWAPIKMEG